VKEATPAQTVYTLEGSALLSTDADPARAARGFDVNLLGHLIFDRKTGAFVRFDVVALGEHWGEGPYTRKARPGRSPLGVAIELAPADGTVVPPQFARELAAYLGR
jgi:hypothetical protein